MTAYSASRGLLYTSLPGTDDAETTERGTDGFEDGSSRATADD
jgi:hypothetical protein